MNWGISLDIVPDMHILIIMNKKLAEIFAHLDYKYDIEVSEYFNLPVEDREQLAEYLAENLFNSSNKTPLTIHHIIVQVQNVIRDSENADEFEKADIFFNIEKKLFNKLDTLL